MADTTFISYAHEPKSRRAATELATRLRRDGVLIWMDQWELKPGQIWQPAIESALQQAKTVVAIVGSSERSRSMLEKELQAALEQEKTVIPVLTEDADFDDIPEIIRDRQAVAPTNDKNAYLQLLWALGKSKPESDDLDTLTFWQRMKRYIINE